MPFEQLMFFDQAVKLIQKKEKLVEVVVYGSVNFKPAHPPPPPGICSAFVGHLSFFLNNVANAPRWGQAHK